MLILELFGIGGAAPPYMKDIAYHIGHIFGFATFHNDDRVTYETKQKETQSSPAWYERTSYYVDGTVTITSHRDCMLLKLW